VKASVPIATNKLAVNLKKLMPAGALAGAVLLGSAFSISRSHVHAAISTPPLDEGSVSALTSLDKAMESVTARVTPSIVNVAVTSRGSERQRAEAGGEDDGQDTLPGLPPGFSQFFGGQGGGGRRLQPQQQPLERGVGSGVIISPDGYIVTNNHVVDGAVNIKVTLDDRRILTGKVIGTDPLTDIAVIKVGATGLTPIAWGDSNQLHPGQTVLAFGSPFGSLQFSVTRGIVSALHRPNAFATDARTPGDLIQTDAAINPGNSGGPLVDARGELVGINKGIITASGSFAGAGFAIPSQIVHATVDQLMAHGTVSHGYLGISMNDVTPANARFFNLQNAEGVIVAQVTPDSPASKGGVKQGDVITEANGNKVENGSALQVAVSQMAPGTPLKLGVLRSGQPTTLNLTVGSFHGKADDGSEDADGPGQGGGQARAGKLGLGVADLSEDVRQQIGAPAELHGAVVQTVRPGSPAEDAGLQPGDLVLEVDRKPVSSASQFVTQVHGSSAGKDILLLVWSHGNSSYRVLRAAEEK
jgi:serine protease Do